MVCIHLKKIFFIIIWIAFNCTNNLKAQATKDTSLNFLDRIESDSQAISVINEMLENKANSLDRKYKLQTKLVW
jgi:hypothetical protein